MNSKFKSTVVLIIVVFVAYGLFRFGLVNAAYMPDHSSEERTTIPSIETIPVTSNFLTQDSANDIVVSQNVALVADGANGLLCINVSNPEALNEISNISTTDEAVAVTVKNNIAFLATDGSGLRIINISNYYDLQEIASDTSISSIKDVYVEGQFVYAAAGANGLICINISDVTNPIQVGILPLTNAQSVYISGHLAFVADGSAGVRLINVMDPENPVLLDTLATTDAHDLEVNGNKIFIADTSGLILAKVEASSKINKVSEVLTENGFTGLTIAEDNVYATHPTNTSIIHVSNSSTLELLGANFTGGSKIFIADYYAYLARGSSGIVVARVIFNEYLGCLNNFYDPYYSGISYGILGSATDIHVTQDIVFVSTLKSGLRAYNISQITRNQDVSSENNLTSVGTWKGSLDLTGLTIIGDLAYVSTYKDGLYIINISNPCEMVEVGVYMPEIIDGSESNAIKNLIVDEDTVYFTVDYGYISEGRHMHNIFKVDITNPATPTLLGNITLNIAFINDFEINSKYGYICGTNSTMEGDETFICVYDFSDSQNPSQLYNLTYREDFYRITDIKFDGSLAFVSTTANFSIWNASNAPFLTPIVEYDELTIDSGKTEISGRLMIISNDLSLQLYDISDINDISLVSTYLVSTNVELNLYFDGTTIWGSNGGIFKILTAHSYSDDFDLDSLNLLEEMAIGTNVSRYDSDGDNLNDYYEYQYNLDPINSDPDLWIITDYDGDGLCDLLEYRINSNPLNPDTDGDGFADGYEYYFFGNPTDVRVESPLLYHYLFIGLIIMGLIASFTYVMKAYSKNVLVKVYISHAPEDLKPYRLKKLKEKLSSKKQIVGRIYDPKENKKRSIDEWRDRKMDDCQVMVFFATENSQQSPISQKDLNIARKNQIYIVPVKSESIGWSDMADLELDRELGVEHSNKNQKKFFKDTIGFAQKFQVDLTKLRNELKKHNTSFVELLEKSTDIGKEQIERMIVLLLRGETLKGALSEDKSQFINAKLVKKKIKTAKKITKLHDIEKLAKKAGLSEDTLFSVNSILNNNPSKMAEKKKNKMKKKKNMKSIDEQNLVNRDSELVQEIMNESEDEIEKETTEEFADNGRFDNEEDEE